jgi:hypothetical protein
MIEDRAVVLMKVGYHAQEHLHSIVQRKRSELRSTGQTWWGYGGSVCNPQKQVHPFARESGGAVTVVFLPTSSRPGNPSEIARSWSLDKAVWSPMPNGINVTGSKYALVLDQLEEVDESIDLARYIVGIGNSIGKPVTDYLRFQCDKACVRRNDASGVRDDRHVVLRGRLKEPWAVFLGLQRQ